ncbi:MAG: hypothetical protein ACRDRT_06135, partial [Pseudonocardiaceae bacterium]
CARMSVWTYAFDDYIEQEVSSLTELDDMLCRCGTIVRTGIPDDSHPLLAVLSRWQADLMKQPLYPALAALWAQKFDDDLRGVRYDWVTGRAREKSAGAVSSVEEYLDHADSILAWMVHFPRWIYGGDARILDYLDVLIPALDEFTYVLRLANDLATIFREKNQKGQNNVLMYGVSPEWVRAELAERMTSGRRHLAPLLAEDHLSAHGLIRLAEWAVSFYELADFRASDERTPWRKS